ncbi:MAG: hypothetical protein CO113_10025 [Elusimicrobia bacterium CG_4_9_14_3_um_filter_62_55]|nr:MAG: hypothetical protein COR54_07645 [Elusimicrobia bacterium CG22_combo_CG10-13_8_21_14_all_63_91]PJA13203.1 MAG: hypothetical protein COX66_15545 [Elusimicrobia bacterium CG_4_10_14_0_2_um_filter_63_34]PJB25174.1 MAG: hypothetical protein CO113_10025 [Elusimicrobia bacterium CG_4_9_14_3_um_filter_62_55]
MNRSFVVACSVLFSLAPPSEAAVALPVPIGTAAVVRGVVRALLPDRPQAVGRVIGSGQPVYVGERVVTGDEGRLQILLRDGSVFTVGPRTSMVLDRYVYDENKGAGELSADVLKGVFRYISGRIAQANPKAVKLKLPAGTLGIEGTELLVRVAPDGRSDILLHSGRARLSTDAGSFEISRAGDVLSAEPGRVPRPAGPADAALKRTFDADLSPGAFAALTSPAAAAAAAAALGADSALGTTLDETGSLAQAGGVELYGMSLSDYLLPYAGGSVGAGAGTWDDLRNIPGGSASYNGTGVFTQATNGGFPCVGGGCTGTWSFTHTVDFAARTVTTSDSITTGFIADAAEGTFSFAALSGAAAYVDSSGAGGTYSFQFLNADGEPAKQLLGTVAYAAGGSTGSGVPVTATRSP